MTTRQEKVRLDLEDHFTKGMIAAAGATALLKKELNDLSGTSVSTSRSQEQVSKSTESVGKSTERASKKTKEYTLEMAKADVAASRLRKSLTDEAKAALDAEQGIDKNNATLREGTKDIDRYSGRLRLLTEAAVVIGPALVPIGAVAVPAVVALAAGLGAAAGAAGVALIAFNGIGDALGALDAYQLDPSTAHLEKMRQEFEKIGPTGVQFVKFLDDLEPQLKDLQTVTREGLFPGVEDGITSLLTMLPQVRVILFNLSTELGRLSAEAGKALSGDGAKAFFDYLEADAAPTMEAFAHTLGNVAAGLGSLMVAFAPLSRDFSSGMEAMSKSFADWAAGLSETDGFRDFVSYVRESGPQVLDLLGSLAKAFINIAQAAAPVGTIVLNALTALAKVLSAIASSPIGPPLFTAAAAMLALSRATTIATASMSRLGASAATTTATVGKLKAMSGMAAGVLAVGVAVGALADNIGRIDANNLDRSLKALSFGNVTNEIDDVIGSLEELTATRNKIDLGEIVTAGGLFGDSTLDKYADNVDQVDQKLAQLVESGNAKEAAVLFAQITALAKEQGVSLDDTKDAFDAYALAVENSTGPSSASADAARKLAQAHNQQAAMADRAAESTAGLTASMQAATEAALGAFDAETQYRQALKDAAAQAKKNEAGIRGNSKAVLENRGALSQLAGAWNGQSNAVKNNVSRWKEARGAFIETAAAMGVPIKQAKALADRLMEIPKSVVIRQQNNMDPAVKTAKLLAAAIRNIPTSWLTNYTINTTRTGSDPELHGPRADGGTIYGRRQPYGDKVLVPLAPGEEVISNRRGQADRHRSLLKAINSGSFGGGLADGGTAGLRTYASVRGGGSMFALVSAAGDASVSLRNLAGLGKKELEVRAKLLQKEVDRDKQREDALRSQMQSLSSSVTDRYRSNVFETSGDLNSLLDSGLSLSAATQQVQGDPLAKLRAQIAAAREANRLRRKAMRAGIDGQALAALGTDASPEQIRALIANPADARQYDNLFDRRQRVSGVTGRGYGEGVYGKQLAAATAIAQASNAELRQLNRRMAHLEKLAEKNPKETGAHVGDSVNTAVASGRSGRAY